MKFGTGGRARMGALLFSAAQHASGRNCCKHRPSYHKAAAKPGTILMRAMTMRRQRTKIMGISTLACRPARWIIRKRLGWKSEWSPWRLSSWILNTPSRSCKLGWHPRGYNPLIISTHTNTDPRKNPTAMHPFPSLHPTTSNALAMNHTPLIPRTEPNPPQHFFPSHLQPLPSTSATPAPTARPASPTP